MKVLSTKSITPQRSDDGSLATKVEYAICADSADHGPFDPIGIITDDLRLAIRALKRERRQRPWAYIARHHVTKLSLLDACRLELQQKQEKFRTQKKKKG